MLVRVSVSTSSHSFVSLGSSVSVSETLALVASVDYYLPVA